MLARETRYLENRVNDIPINLVSDKGGAGLIKVIYVNDPEFVKLYNEMIDNYVELINITFESVEACGKAWWLIKTEVPKKN